MACCLKQPTNQLPNDVPLRKSTSKDVSQVLALGVAIFGNAMVIDCGFTKPNAADFCGALAAPTLQSCHVRIQT